MDTLINLATVVYVSSLPFAAFVVWRDEYSRRRRSRITARDIVTWACVSAIPVLNTFIAGLFLMEQLNKVILWERGE